MARIKIVVDDETDRLITEGLEETLRPLLQSWLERDKNEDYYNKRCVRRRVSSTAAYNGQYALMLSSPHRSSSMHKDKRSPVTIVGLASQKRVIN